MSTVKRELGCAPCLRCGAAVLWKVRADGRAGAYCNGHHDRKACGGAWTLGKLDTADFIREQGFDGEPVKQDPKPAAGNNNPKPEKEPKSDGGNFLSDW